MTDYGLIRAYVEHNDREAIGALVGRYVDVVYASALRQVRDRQAAEDVTQGVFLLLLQKCGGFGSGVKVGAWLLQATYYASLRAMRDLRRRQYHERKAAGERVEADEVEEPTRHGWVDQAIRALREVDREAVILRFMRGLPLAAVGAELGISEEAARKRVDRAVEKLRASAPAEAQAMGIAAALAAAEVRAPEAMLVKVLAPGGSGMAAVCAASAGTALVMAKIKVAAALLITASALAAGVVLLSQVRASGSAQAVATTAPAEKEATVKDGDLALACWGAIVPEAVAERLWRQIGGTGARFAPRTPLTDQRTGVEIGRADAGIAQAEAIRTALRQVVDDGAEINWAIWAPAVNRIAGPDGMFRYSDRWRQRPVQVIVEGPGGAYKQSGGVLALPAPAGWFVQANVPGVQGNGFAADLPTRLRLGQVAVMMVEVPGSREWLTVMFEPWVAPRGTNQQTTAETFPNPEPWVRGGPVLAQQWYDEARRVTSHTPDRRPEDVIVQAIDDQAEVRVPFVRDLERNPLICFAAKDGRPVQIMFGRRDGACIPVQRPELEMALYIVDPRVVYGYRPDGSAVTLDERMEFYMMAYAPRVDGRFEREFGAGQYERLGRCPARGGETITLENGAAVTIKAIARNAERSSAGTKELSAHWSVEVDATPPDDGEYVAVAFDEQDRPHFPTYYAPIRRSALDGMSTTPRVRAGTYAIAGEIKAFEVWQRKWKKVAVAGYARELRQTQDGS